MASGGTYARLFNPIILFALLCAVLAGVGMHLHTERFITPESGVGYSLGIVGGSSMLLLLLYSARKRWAWLSLIGSVQRWFQVHMMLGLVGPLLILFHSNFRLGATNSNVALFCMLVVSVSGLFGRYFYGRIHVGFEVRKADFGALRAELDRLQQESEASPGMAEVAMQLKVGVLHFAEGLDRVPEVLRPPFIARRAWRLRRQLDRLVDEHLKAAARGGDVDRESRRRTRGFVAQYIDAARKVVEFAAYERLFSAWHILHLPLFFMLLLAGIVHVVAVHIY
ncbi:MAG: hypothetical protein RLZZ393_759 [Pseudomonadota bacterium]|jgi:hypothetical protein